MKSFSGRDRTTISVLAFVAGYVDATAFMASEGFFVSFMSGNSTRLGVGLVTRASFALTALGIIAAFLLGVTLAAIASRTVTRNRPQGLLYAIAGLIAVAALAANFAAPRLTLAFLATAMGAENLLYERDGEVRFGVTYMTGALVRIGMGIGVALSGGNRWDWLPFLQLWAALVAGCALGATAFQHFGFAALWFAVFAILFVALVQEASRPRVPH